MDEFQRGFKKKWGASQVHQSKLELPLFFQKNSSYQYLAHLQKMSILLWVPRGAV
jgi:hypothetical protein